jgi:adenosylcobinamide kinase/adenosylcobinamide-phosphate guanylyltransferase
MSHAGFALVGGGARSGKSSFALRLAQSRGTRRVFIATAIAFDEEMRERIERHKDERGRSFATVEAPRDLDLAVARLARDRESTPDVVLVDCLTLWLSNLLLDGVPASAIEQRVDSLATTLAAAPFASIVVTNEVGMGLVPETPLGRAFRDISGGAHQRLARVASQLYFATMGTVVRLKPAPVALADDGFVP